MIFVCQVLNDQKALRALLNWVLKFYKFGVTFLLQR